MPVIQDPPQNLRGEAFIAAIKETAARPYELTDLTIITT